MKAKSDYMRIVSLAPSNTEILFALHAEKELVGVTRFCDYPSPALAIEHVSGWTDVDPERILSLKPDLVLTSTFVQDKIVAALKLHDIPVHHVSPYTLQDVYASIKEIGSLVDKKEEAHSLITSMREAMDALAGKLSSVTHFPNIYCEEWHLPPMASGNWVPELLALAKAHSLLKPGEPSREVSLAELEAFDAEAMILSWCGAGDKPNTDIVLRREGWRSLRFMENNAIHVLHDSFLNRPGPRLVQGLEKLARLLHPECFQ